MTCPRPLLALLVLCAFFGAQLAHALHPLSHARTLASSDDACCSAPAELPLGDGPTLADAEDDHGANCSLCAASPPVAPVELPATLAPAPADAVVVRLLPADAPARGPPASFRSRAPPAV